MREINKKLGSAVWSGSLPVTTGYVWGPDTFVPRSGLAEVDRLDLTSSRPGVRAGREYSLPWGREEKDSLLLMWWEKGKGVQMGGRKRRDANPCTDGRGGGGGNGEDKVTRRLRGMRRGYPRMNYPTLPAWCCEGEERWGIWPVICCMAEPSFDAVGMEMAVYASPQEKKGEIHIPSSWLNGDGRCLPWWQGQLGQRTTMTWLGQAGCRKQPVLAHCRQGLCLGRLSPLRCYLCPSFLKTKKPHPLPLSLCALGYEIGEGGATWLTEGWEGESHWIWKGVLSERLW